MQPRLHLLRLPLHLLAWHLPGTNIRHLLYNSAARDSGTVATTHADSPLSQLSFGGRIYTLSTCNVQYNLLQHVSCTSGSLIDGGANGGMSGAAGRVLAQGVGKADVSGIADKSVTNLSLSTVAYLSKLTRALSSEFFTNTLILVLLRQFILSIN
jgi:hypothetical protein